eukprot:CAMPEP_0174725152 /NCGR_PEP_ID=MMETSP1094-20130205/44906_1 /TAXON_ID=156173 /ORGANISM="Chrysochromulina brevifilum, Strain UTEX LB 985" /LENGTH=60 /DNA_ID=CAMNT_0015926505 /DNA_START=267 /DNA_END=449 /DNA_ORIENTATION=-
MTVSSICSEHETAAFGMQLEGRIQHGRMQPYEHHHGNQRGASTCEETLEWSGGERTAHQD